MKCMQKNFHRNILICVYGFFFVCILGGITVWASYQERSFSPKGWLNCNPAKRYLYIDDLEESITWLGCADVNRGVVRLADMEKNRAGYRKDYIL